MPESKYTVQYDTSSAIKAAQDVDRLTRSIEAMDAAATKSKRSTADLAAGAANSAADAAPKVQQLAGAMDRLADSGAKAKAALGDLRDPAESSAASMVAFGVAASGIAAGLALLRSYNEQMKSIADFAATAADDVARLRDATRELKSLGDKPAADDSTIPEILKMDVQTGVGLKAATDFAVRFKGASATGVDRGNISPTTRDEFMAESLREARRLGMDPNTMGSLAGSVANFGKVGSVAQGMDQVGAAAWGMKQGRDTFTEHAKAMRKLMPMMVKGPGGGGIRDVGEAGVILGAVDPIAGSADQAQQMIIQSNRLLSQTQGAPGDYLKSIGIKPGMDWSEKMNLLAPHVQGPEAKMRLDALGFHQQRQQEVTVAISKQMPVIDKRLAERRSRDFGQGEIDANDAFMAAEPAARRGRADARVRAATTIRGLENEEYRTAQQEATAQLLHEGVLDSKDSAMMNAIYEAKVMGVPIVGAPGVPSAAQARINSRAQENLVKGIKDTGLVDTQTGWLPNKEAMEFTRKYPGLLSGQAEDPAKAFRELAPKVRDLGGQPFGDTKGIEGKLDTMIGLMREGKGIAAVMPDVPMPGKPAVVPKRP